MTEPNRSQDADTSPDDLASKAEQPEPVKVSVPEVGGPKGPEPTRYGDWERKGRCIDF